MSDDRVLVLGHSAVEQLLSLDEVVTLVRDSYIALARGEARLFPLVREQLDTALFGLRSAYWGQSNLLGLKASGYFPENAEHGRPNHQACIVLLSPHTGLPRAFLDGNQITLIRTAAVGALGTSLLSRPDARRILVIGNGHQAEAQIRSHAALLADRNPEFSVIAPRDDAIGTKVAAFARRLAEGGLSVAVGRSLAGALADADIVVTATPSREPLVHQAGVAPGTHFTAIGSDTPGKRELDPKLVLDALLVVDDRAQSERFGESQGLDRDPETVVTIGEVLDGRAEGRRSNDEITVFDSTGIGLHDIVTAEFVCGKALSQESNAWVSLT
jgi:alanine dehydrogenase